MRGGEDWVNLFRYRDRLSPRQRILTFACVALAASALLVQGALRPYRLYRESLDLEIRRKSVLVRGYERLLPQKRGVEEMAREAPAFRASGSAEEEFARFLKELEKLARSSSLSVHRMKPLAANRKDFYSKFAVELELAGSLEDLAGFMLAVEGVEMATKIQKFGLSASGDANQGLIGRFTLTRLLSSE